MARWSSVGALAGLAALVRPENGLYLAVAGALLIVTAVLAWLRPGARAAAPLGVIARAVLNGGGLVLGFGCSRPGRRATRPCSAFQPLNPQSVSMPGEFVPAGYEAWVRTWIDHPRYVEPFLFALDAAPLDARAMPASAFDDVVERARVETLLGPYNAPAPDADPGDKGTFAPGGMKPALDAGFAELARERIARRPFRHYVALPLRRALALWFNPHADFYPFAGRCLRCHGAEIGCRVPAARDLGCAGWAGHARCCVGPVTPRRAPDRPARLAGLRPERATAWSSSR